MTGVTTNAALPNSALSRQASLAIFVALLGLAVVVLDGALLNLALPAIARHMQVSAATSIWAINAYQLATLVCLLPFANLGDRLGYRQVYLGGMALFVLGAVMAAFAPNLAMLVVARALQGAGGGAIISVSTALVRLIFPPDRVGRGIALNSMVIALSSVAGPTISALVLEVASWRWLFIISLPVALVVLGLGQRVLPDNNSKPQTPLYLRDVLLNGLMFVLLFVGADLLVMQSTGATNWRLWGLAMIAAAGVVGVYFLRRQSRLPAPLFPVDLMRMPTFALAVWAAVAGCAGLSLMMVTAPFLLLEAFGRSPFEAGMLMTAWPAAIFLVAPIVGRLIGRVHSGVLGGIGMLTMALGLVAMALLPEQPSNLDIAWRLGLAGAGFGMFQAPNNHAIVVSPPANRAGVASGMVGTSRLAGMTVGAVIVAQIFAHWPPSQSEGPTIAIWTGVVAALIAGVCSASRMRVNAGKA